MRWPIIVIYCLELLLTQSYWALDSHRVNHFPARPANSPWFDSKTNGTHVPLPKEPPIKHRDHPTRAVLLVRRSIASPILAPQAAGNQALYC